MKQYEKRYEDFFKQRHKGYFLGIDSISTDIGLNGQEYADLMYSEFRKAEKELFYTTVKYHWLISRFHYRGRPRLVNFANGTHVDTAFGIFMKKYAACNKEVFTDRRFYRITTYFEDFFPNFHIYNPLKEPEKYEFPYKNVGLGYLLTVYQVDERLELLDYAEKNKMNFRDFVNYVINQILCINEDLGYEKYTITFMSYSVPYIKNMDLKNKGTGIETKKKNKNYNKKFKKL